MSEYITLEGMQRLQKRINILAEERPLVLEQVQAARELGDISENAEYHAAREKQRSIEREVAYLNSRMANLKIIDPATLPKDAIRFGAYIKILETTSNEIFNYHLVGVDEIYERDDDIIQVSVASPLGKAMIGKKINDEFVVNAPKGDRYFKVLEIK